MSRETGTVLIVDDDESLRTLLTMRLQASGFGARAVATGDEALRAAGRVDAVLLDLRLAGGEDGLEVLQRLRDAWPDLPVLILTAHGTIAGAVQALKQGAAGYLTKPVDHEELLAQVGQAVRRGRESRELRALKQAVAAGDELMGIVGRSPAMKRVFEQVTRIAGSDLTVSVYGESGTGKELVSRAIHALSPRARGPFLAVNCAALPETLLESELFGHVKGAFTDARQAKEGLFKRADGGTLLLDEIGDMSPKVQAALLRVLQEGEFTPVGGTRSERVDVRVIVATNKDLRNEVRAGRFREDLFYRVQVLPIHLPPLRERPEDIPLLAMRFLEAQTARLGRQDLRGFTQGALDRLQGYRWPGNVRELEACIARAALMATGERVTEDDLFPAGADESATASSASGAVLPFNEAKAAFERDYLVRLLKTCKGNVSAVARAAGRYRADVYAMLRHHGLDPADFREG